MNAYTRPGIGFFDARDIVLMITQEFELPDDSWVKTEKQEGIYCVARQILITCLIDHLNYKTRQAGDYINRGHSNVVTAHKRVVHTLWNDRKYGRNIRSIYNRCREMKGIQ